MTPAVALVAETAADAASESQDIRSLLAIAAISAAVPLIVGLLRLRVAEVVLLIGAGIVFGPQLLGWIQPSEGISVFSELGLGFLFFLAGFELDQRALRGQSGTLAVVGWGVSLLISGVVVGALDLAGIVSDFLGVSIALTSTALGTLLPVLRDSGRLATPFGRFFMAAGAWGEFGPILAISLLLGTQSSFVAILTLLGFAAVAAVLAILPGRFATDRVRELLEIGHRTSSQTAVRITVLLMIALLSLAGNFGLDVVLGAFVAGIIMRRYAPEEEESVLQNKIEGLAFGFFIPLFFVVSGANLDVDSIVANPLRLLLFFSLLFLVRGLPQYFLYRRAIPATTERTQFMLYVATGLPIIVAVTTLELKAGIMQPDNAAALVGAGALSVLVFPLAADMIARRAAAKAADVQPAPSR